MSESVETLIQRATEEFWNGAHIQRAKPLLKAALAQEPDNLVAQWFLFQCELIEGDVQSARARGEVLMRLSPHSPIMLLSLVRALVAGGDFEAARSALAEHLGPQDPAADRMNLGPNQIAGAILLELVGENDRSFEMSRAMCREDDVPLIDWSQVENATGIRATLAHMQDRVRGRDICIFGRGPSLATLEGAADAMRDCDFVPFVINEFQDVAANILARMGKRPSLVNITSYEVLRACADDLRALCATEEFIGLSLPQHTQKALESSTSERELADAVSAGSHRLFSYTCEGELNCPIPRRPLDFPIVNTLLHALGTAILLKPRRIFLFGFDGAVNAATGEYYYAEQSKTTSLKEGWEDRTVRWLWWDAFRMSHIAPCFVNHLHLLHEVDHPLIYNVCKKSAITCFPRIGVDDYLALTKGDA